MSGGARRRGRALRDRLARQGTALAALVVVVVLAVPLLGAFRSPGAPMEEGKLLVAADLVLDGRLPHADFEHFYGPADVWSVAGAFALLGHSVHVERLVGLGYLAILLGALFALVRRVGRVPAAVATILTGLLIAPFGVHAYSWIAGLGLLLLATTFGLDAVERAGQGGRRPWLSAVVAGGSLGLALLFRADLVVAAVGLVAVLAPRLDHRQRTRALVATAVTGGVPYLVHLLLAGIGPVWQGMIVDTLVHLRAGRHLPVPPPGDALTAWLDLSAPEPAPSRFFPDPARVHQLQAFFWLTVLAIAGAAVAGLWTLLRRRGRPEAPTILAFAVIAVGIAPQMLQRADVTHVRFVAVVALPMAIAAITLTLALVDARVPRSAVATEAFALVAVALVLAVPFYAVRLLADDVRKGTGRLDVPSVGLDGRTFPVAPPLEPDARAVVALVDELGPDHGRLFVGPQDLRLANYSDAFLYFVLGERYRPTSFYLESNPGIANGSGSTLADDLGEADVLVLSKEYDNWDEPNDSRVQGPVAPEEVVAQDFCLAAEAGRYQVWLRDGRCEGQ